MGGITMKIKFIKNKYEYEIKSNGFEYGFKVIVYKDDNIIGQQGGFGSIACAKSWARYLFLLESLDLDINETEKEAQE